MPCKRRGKARCLAWTSLGRSWLKRWRTKFALTSSGFQMNDPPEWSYRSRNRLAAKWRLPVVNTGLVGRVARVTGANHGIGAAIARALAAHGAAVYLTFFRAPTLFSRAELEEARDAGVGGARLYAARQQHDGADVAAAIRYAGGRAESQERDRSDPDSITTLFSLRECLRRGGRLSQ